MKIVTWNMGRAHGAWDYLHGKLETDFALLQETFARPSEGDHFVWEPIGSDSKHGELADFKWGSGVWSREQVLETVPTSAPPGWVAAAQPVGSEPLILLSMHVELDKDGRSTTTLDRLLTSLSPLLESTDLLVLGGDLNTDVSFDEQYGTTRHSTVLKRIEDYGFWHCNSLIPSEKRQTFRGRSRGPVMDDHLFVRESMAPRVTSCEVWVDEGCPSDHFPVVLQLD